MSGRIVGLIAAAVLAIVMTLAAFSILIDSRRTPAPQSTGVATVGGPFTLSGTEGQEVTEKDLLGKPSAVFFGFTFCPDVCPLTLANLTAVADALGPKADELTDRYRSTSSLVGD